MLLLGTVAGSSVTHADELASFERLAHEMQHCLPFSLLTVVFETIFFLFVFSVFTVDLVKGFRSTRSWTMETVDMSECSTTGKVRSELGEGEHQKSHPSAGSATHAKENEDSHQTPSDQKFWKKGARTHG